MLHRQAPGPLPSLHPLILTSLVRPSPLTGLSSALTHRGRTSTPSQPNLTPTTPSTDDDGRTINAVTSLRLGSGLSDADRRRDQGASNPDPLPAKATRTRCPSAPRHRTRPICRARPLDTALLPVAPPPFPPADSGELEIPAYLVISRRSGHLSLRKNSPMPPGSGSGHAAAPFGKGQGRGRPGPGWGRSWLGSRHDSGPFLARGVLGVMSVAYAWDVAPFRIRVRGEPRPVR